MEILVISGLSGSGKSKAASFLEDIGYYIVDNLPAEMMVVFAEFCAASKGRYDRVALVYDVRTGEPAQKLIDALEQMKAAGIHCRMLFLEADNQSIINRYKETRRTHPLAGGGVSVAQALQKERALLQPVRDHADFVLNTSGFSASKLHSEILNLFSDASLEDGMHVNVLSFGFKNGIPVEADLVMDVRFMPNPYYIEELKHKTGLDDGVRDYVFSFSQTNEFMRRMEEMMSFLLPLYSEEGKTVLVRSPKPPLPHGRHRLHRRTPPLRSCGPRPGGIYPKCRLSRHRDPSRHHPVKGAYYGKRLLSCRPGKRPEDCGHWRRTRAVYASARTEAVQ